MVFHSSILKDIGFNNLVHLVRKSVVVSLFVISFTFMEFVFL